MNRKAARVVQMAAYGQMFPYYQDEAELLEELGVAEAMGIDTMTPQKPCETVSGVVQKPLSKRDVCSASGSFLCAKMNARYHYLNFCKAVRYEFNIDKIIDKLIEFMHKLNIKEKK